ncbi:hypothetical protein Tco_1222790, partial [Tanacetum coccineum]
AKEKLASICSERVRLEDLLRKANSDYHGDGKFVELQEKYVQVFKDPISFDVGMNYVDGDDGDDDDGDGNGDDDARGDSDVNRDDDNADSRNDDDVGGDGNGNEDDAGNGDDEDGGCKSIEKQVDATTKEVDATTKEVDATTKEVDATTKENVVEESDEITCTPESFSQWIDANSDFILEQIDCVVDEYLYGDALDAIAKVAEDMRINNKGTVTPERLVTRHSKASSKRMVKPSSYLLSPYMNKKTKVLPKINRSEFMIGASLFAMQRDKIETVFETTSGEEKVLGIRLNMETLSPGLCIDANVVDCWAEILNYEDRFRKDGSLSRHFFPTGCITKSMFDGTLSTYEEKWKSFAAEVSAQFKDNVGGLALSGIDLKKLFASHLRLYGHERHSKIGRLKARIPKLKWKTKANVKDCGIFTMLHMKSYIGQTVKTWDCGLVAESKQQCDMLRQLRFKFATKILLHEINVHAQKMIRYAKEFDKIMGFVVLLPSLNSSVTCLGN